MSFLRAFWIALFLLGAVTSASEASTGLRVVGDSRLRVTAEQRIGAWLASHGHQYSERALGAASLAALDECYLRDEPACANKVFASNSESDLFIYVSFEVNAAGARERNVRGSMWLLRKDGEAAVFTQNCDACEEAAIADMIDKLTERVGSFDPRSGTISLSTTPEGALVRIDGKDVGYTPMTKDLLSGPHEVALLREGYRVDRHTVRVVARNTIEHEVVLQELAVGSSRKRRFVTYVTTAMTAALLVGGVTALLLHEDNPCDARQKTCFNAKLGGGITLAGAAVMAGVSGYLWWTMEDPEPMGPMMGPTTPTAPKGPRAYVLGLGGSF